MKISVGKSEIKGKFRAPSSKSYTLRGVLCAGLAPEVSYIQDPLTSDDTESCLRVLNQIGVQVHLDPERWRIAGGNFHEPATELFCGESAATLRFMTAICAAVPGKSVLTAAPSLEKRPIEPLITALKKLKVDISLQSGKVTVKNTGKFRGGEVELPGDISSQYVSALLLAAPLAEQGMKIKLTTPLESRPYVLMTLESLNKFGIEVNSSEDLSEYQVCRQTYRGTQYQVEGDWSSASYLLALGAVAGQLSMDVDNMNPESLQGDRVILDYLKEMGVSVGMQGEELVVEKRNLNAFSADLINCIDLLPTLAVLAALAKGTTEFTGIRRARLKESNRVAALKEGLEKAGIKVVEEENRFAVTGGKPRKAVIDAKNDHRIAMAFSILGVAAGGITIDGAESVSKTYPDFWNILRGLGAKISEQ